MKTRKNLAILALTLVGLMVFLQAVFAGGSLEPSAGPGVIFKTLDEVEPRILIKASDLPLTISEPNSYYLAETINFSVTDTNAITIECDDVTIDLMGYCLIGPGKAVGTSGNGIYMNARDNVEIRNGTIRNFRESGIKSDYYLDENHRIIGVRVLSNGSSGISLLGYDHMVKDCTASNNMLYGISVGRSCVITGNTARNNLDTGISVGSNCVITGNTTYGNVNNGISTSHNCTIISNTAVGNMASGISVGLSCVITGNTATANQNSGIYATFNGCTIIGNTANSNAFYGIYAGGNSLVDQNASYGNVTNMYTGPGCSVGLNVAP